MAQIAVGMPDQNALQPPPDAVYGPPCPLVHGGRRPTLQKVGQAHQDT
jgi:hypothetical protein